jgi:hypothetical protein
VRQGPLDVGRHLGTLAAIPYLPRRGKGRKGCRRGNLGTLVPLRHQPTKSSAPNVSLRLKHYTCCGQQGSFMMTRQAPQNGPYRDTSGGCHAHSGGWANSRPENGSAFLRSKNSAGKVVGMTGGLCSAKHGPAVEPGEVTWETSTIRIIGYCW